MYYPYVMFYDPTYFLVLIGLIISFAVQMYMNHTYAKFSKVSAQINMTAYDVVKELFRVKGINDVSIGHIPGYLTDHYAPSKKELNLSDSTFQSRSIAAIGVAAHECGHVLQDEYKYAPLKISLYINPVVSIVSSLSIPILIVGLILGWTKLFNLGIILFSVTFLYQILTLPIEFNASKRAIEALRETQILTEAEIYGASKVLRAAALTYVAAAIVTSLQLLRFVLLSRNNKN